MELIDEYPQLNNSLISHYGSAYQLEQTHIDQLIQFIQTLSESDEEIKRKEVNPNEDPEDTKYIRKGIHRGYGKAHVPSKKREDKKRTISQKVKE